MRIPALFAMLCFAAQPALAQGLSGNDRTQFVTETTKACVSGQNGVSTLGQLGMGEGQTRPFCACVSEHLANVVTSDELAQLMKTHALPDSVGDKTADATQTCLANVVPPN